jgi:hypothetical protein
VTWADDDRLELAARQHATRLRDNRDRVSRPAKASHPAPAGTPTDNIEIGSWIFTRHTEAGRIDGVGVVLEMLDGYNDWETGETIGVDYRIYNPGTGMHTIIPAADIIEASAPATPTIWSCIDRLWRDAQRASRQHKLDTLHDINQLARALPQ